MSKREQALTVIRSALAESPVKEAVVYWDSGWRRVTSKNLNDPDILALIDDGCFKAVFPMVDKEPQNRKR